MTLTIKKLIKSAIGIIFSLSAFHANAQVSPIQNLINKIESYRNFSYESINRRKEYGTIDTVITYGKELFLKTPADKLFGYLFKLESQESGHMSSRIDLYNGKDLRLLLTKDSTFRAPEQPLPYRYTTLLGSLRSIKGLLDKKPSSRVVKVSDTIINGHINNHLIITFSDTTINNEHLYSRRQFFIDKNSGLLTLIISQIRSKSHFDANAFDEFYDEMHYSNYKFDQKGITNARFRTPKEFHPPQKKTESVKLLEPGSAAPDWTLYDANNKKVSLSEMRGKVILLDFYFIGCKFCMLSLKPLNSIYEKYNPKDVVVASINGQDKAASVAAFEKRYNIKYPGYVNASDVVKSYHVIGAPTFYIIDKEGKISNVIEGYSDDFESKVTAMIDKLLNK